MKSIQNENKELVQAMKAENNNVDTNKDCLKCEEKDHEILNFEEKIKSFEIESESNKDIINKLNQMINELESDKVS